VNIKTTTTIREACSYVRDELGIKIIGGAWFEWNGDKIVATDPIGAVILKAGKVPKEIDPKHPETLSQPGLIKVAKDELGVDHFWLYRFWMGYDRFFQIKAITDKDQEIKDDVSEFGISLAREFLVY